MFMLPNITIQKEGGTPRPYIYYIVSNLCNSNDGYGNDEYYYGDNGVSLQLSLTISSAK